MRRAEKSRKTPAHLFLSFFFTSIYHALFQLSYPIRNSHSCKEISFFITAHDTNEFSLSHEILLMLICWIHPMIATTGDAAAAASVYILYVCYEGLVVACCVASTHKYKHAWKSVSCSLQQLQSSPLCLILQKEIWKIPAPTDWLLPSQNHPWCALQYKHTFMLKHILCFGSLHCMMIAIREKSMLLLLWNLSSLLCKNWFCFLPRTSSKQERGRGRASSRDFSLTEKYFWQWESRKTIFSLFKSCRQTTGYLMHRQRCLFSRDFSFRLRWKSPDKCLFVCDAIRRN